MMVVLPLAFSFAQTLATTPPPPNAGALPTTLKNAPFSADVSTQYDRDLPYGAHIHRETKGRVFRDAQGRVRTETQTPSLSGSPESYRHIVIQDPVLREVVHLHAQSKTATIHHFGDATASTLAENSVVPPSRADSALLVVPQGGQSATAVPLQHSTPVRPPTVESLGAQIISGIAVVGTRTTRVFADSEGGPVVSVTDVWYSRELQMVIFSTSDDGQGGRSQMRVTNILRSAPNAQLFQVPPDYTVKGDNPITAVIKH
jgi:hypothetical protein